jgi:hypothetical protein
VREPTLASRRIHEPIQLFFDTPMAQSKKARALGFNHIALEAGLAHLSKSAKAIKELADKGMAPD